jgi:NAD(P)-dependent dehydrogenase (short-subunit alcohol dehydrogenase family)
MTSPPLITRLFSLDGRAALVTGASSGIGRAIAVAYAEAGAVVALNGTREEGLAETARLIAEVGGRSVSLPAELSEVERCRRLVADAHAALGRLDILVNCAGMNRRKPIVEVTEEDWDTIQAVNLKSAFFLSQAAHPLMAAQGGGKIVNIGSMTSSLGIGTVAVYGTTKAALAQLTKSMAVEWARDNIQVNCLAPGWIVTPLTEKGLFGDPIKKRWIIQRIPAGRPGTPDDLTGTAVFLAAPASDYLTGQLISVEGGFLAGGTWQHDVE